MRDPTISIGHIVANFNQIETVCKAFEFVGAALGAARRPYNGRHLWNPGRPQGPPLRTTIPFNLFEARHEH